MATLSGGLAIGYRNRASGVTITATTAATGYAASKLSNSRMGSRWRSTAGSLTSQTLIADLGSSVDIDVLALIGFNGEDDATVSPKTSENSDLSSPEYDPGSGNAFDTTTYPVLVSDTGRYGRNLINFTQTTKNSRYAGLVLSDSGNPDNYLQGSVFWAGPIWQPANSFRVGETFSIGQVVVGSPGMERALRRLSMELYGLSEGEGRQIESLCRARLRSGRLLVVPRPTLATTFLSEAIYCTLENVPERVEIPISTGFAWKVSLSFVEVED